MKTIDCVPCGKTHKISHHNVHRKWNTKKGIVKGWGCAKWVSPTPETNMSRAIKSEKNASDKQKEAWHNAKDDIVQPMAGNDISREYVEAHPKSAQKMFTPQQIKKSKYIWKDTFGHK